MSGAKTHGKCLLQRTWVMSRSISRNRTQSKKTKAELRTALGLPEGFTVLYVGTLSENKRPEILLDVAQHVREDAYSFVLVGAGEL